ncbi:MAG TPA: hypothetical protein VNT26_17345 [Candidatus Sulfotelmatobacter sp.]|nr:hypothetical protein [Candidatus Sulfotelmatobacter sp.]
MKSTSALQLPLLLILSLMSLARAELRVWPLTETRHVLRSEPPGSGSSVQISAARNEWVSFQVLLRSNTPTKNVSLEAGVLAGPEQSFSSMSSG